MQYWMVKTEPGDYTWEAFVEDGVTMWDGVRNYQARNNLRAMKKGDTVLFYRSVKKPAVMGIARVVREAYPDPTTDDPRWVAVDLKAVQALRQPVPLRAIKENPALADLPLLRQPRLSVMPLTEAQFREIVKMGGL